MKLTAKNAVLGLALCAAAAPIDQEKRQLGGLGGLGGGLGGGGLSSVSVPSFGGGGLPSGLTSLGSGGEGGLPSGLPGLGYGSGGLPSGLPGAGSGSSGLRSRIFPSGGSLPTGGFPTSGLGGLGGGSLPTSLPSLGAGSGGSPSEGLPTALPLPSGITSDGGGVGPQPLEGSGLGGEGTNVPTQTTEKRQSLGSLGSGTPSLPSGLTGGSGLGSLPSGLTGSGLGGLGSLPSGLAGGSGLGGLGGLGSGSGLGGLGGSGSDPLSSLIPSSGSGFSSPGGGDDLLGSLGGGDDPLGSLGGGESDPLSSSGLGSTGFSTKCSSSGSGGDASATANVSGGAYPNAKASTYSGGDTANDVSDSTGCRDMTFIFARGTSELGTMGSVVRPPTATDLQKKLGSNGVSVQGVDYPASAEGNADLGGSGGLTMAKLANEALKACPKTKLVLSGYSQGAMVVHNALSSGLDGSSVSAIVVFGDPINGESFKGVDSSRALEVCRSSDFICDHGPINVSGSHLSYGSDAGKAADFVVKTIGL